MMQSNTLTDLDKMKHLLGLLATRDGGFDSGLANITLHRGSVPIVPLLCIYTLSLAAVLQGGKTVLQNDALSHCQAGQALLTTFDLPVISHVYQASRHNTLLAFILKFDYALILTTCAELKLAKPPKDVRFKVLSAYGIHDGLLNALYRLLSFKKDSGLQKGLQPLIEKEIIARLLDGSKRMHLRHLAALGSPISNVLNAVTWLKKNFARTFAMDDLAEHAHMSVSTFRQHFKALTGTSPLQYLKTLRLQEARDQMLVNGVDATLASNLVGYESASQFSREYSKLFGLPSQKDIQRLRQAQLP